MLESEWQDWEVLCLLSVQRWKGWQLPCLLLVMERKDLCLKCLVYSRIAGETSSIELVDRDGMFLVCIDATAPVEGIQTFV